MTPTARRALLYVVIVALAGIVACVLVAAIGSADPACTDPDPCGTEPHPLPQLYLPLVQQRQPAMSAEYAPVQPVPTITPDPAVTGDVQ